jgi:hypothetical protein
MQENIEDQKTIVQFFVGNNFSESYSKTEEKNVHLTLKLINYI